jgi:hypothetical protein
MKKILKPLILILFLSIELVNAAVANPGINIHDKIGEVSPVVKITPVYEGNKNNQVAVLETDFPEAATAFSKMYCAAQSSVWFKDRQSLQVYFEYGGNRVRAALTLKGDLIYAITDLTPSVIPEIISGAIRHAYPFYFVADVKQIKTENITVYRVILENNTGFITLQADEEEVIEIERMQKLWFPAKKINQQKP